MYQKEKREVGQSLVLLSSLMRSKSPPGLTQRGGVKTSVFVAGKANPTIIIKQFAICNV